MAGGQRPPGSGRRKGQPNALTADARRAFAALYRNLLPDAERWIRAAAERDPKDGAALFLRLATHFVPQLQRQEITGEGGGPLTVTIRKGWSDPASSPMLPVSQRAPLVLVSPSEITQGESTQGEVSPAGE